MANDDIDYGDPEYLYDPKELAAMSATDIPQSKATTAHELLSEIRQLILQEPRRYNQGDWLLRKHLREDSEMAENANLAFPSCNTIGCVAGWAVVLRATKLPPSIYWIQKAAGIILGLDEWQQDELFAGDATDTEDEEPKPGTIEHAKAGARHIAAFQEEHEEQLKDTRLEDTQKICDEYMATVYQGPTR